MLKRTLLISGKCRISTKYDQLILSDSERTRSVPAEDIGYVLIEHPESYISLPALNLLLEKNAAVIVCDQRHLPSGMFLPLNSHHQQHRIFQHQIEASQPLKKQLWRQTVKKKILHQGQLLATIKGETNHFSYLSQKVMSGDSTNMEAVAASYYWKAFHEGFKRERFGDYPNNLLNYGYAVLRAATARSLAASGLLNTIGIHHRNKYNAFNLADDIMEPYRPVVDELVYNQLEKGISTDLDKDTKSNLLTLLTRTVFFKGKESPLMVALQNTASSLQQCFIGERKRIKYPDLWN